MGPYAEADFNLTLCPLQQSRLQHIYYRRPYARVNLNPMPESTLSVRDCGYKKISSLTHTANLGHIRTE